MEQGNNPRVGIPLDLLRTYPADDGQEREIESRAHRLEVACGKFGIDAQVERVRLGPTCSLYEVSLPAGTRARRLAVLADDLARSLRVASVRVVPPMPGADLIGVEVPNPRRQTVGVRQVVESGSGGTFPLFLGVDTVGRPVSADFATLPHLLIAGSTGSGKTVCLHAAIVSLLFSSCRLLLIDPKREEFSRYAGCRSMLRPPVYDAQEAVETLAWAAEEMDRRYSGHAARDPLAIVVDELADLVLQAKEVERNIVRIAQKGRAAKMHLLLATQHPVVDVVTGLIKANFPWRIAFRTATASDSRVILDQSGAERLLGAGDMLCLLPDSHRIIRGQGAFLCKSELAAIVKAASGEQRFANCKPSICDDPLFPVICDLIRSGEINSINGIRKRYRMHERRASRLFNSALRIKDTTDDAPIS
jgi:S-DNA-T family DNA segregation ATPase FtsK/SpoIIIE